MSGFTKGPWEWWTSNSLKRLSAGGKDGAVLHAYRCPDGASDIQVSDADARLIAAAPELYGALQMADEWIREAKNAGCAHSAENTLRLIRAALSKAAGEGV